MFAMLGLAGALHMPLTLKKASWCLVIAIGKLTGANSGRMLKTFLVSHSGF